MSAIAVVQMTSRDDPQANFSQAEELLRRAADRGSRLAVLPENFALFAQNAQRRGAAMQPEWLERLSGIARSAGLWIVAGSMPAALRPTGEPVTDNRVRSACFVIDSDGMTRARYDKIHLFDAEVADSQASYRESAAFEPGDSVVVVDTPVGKLGLSICYDLRFPELFLALRRKGAELIAVPAAFTAVTGEAHWELLLRARAVESQCYVLGAGQAGWHSASRQTWGHSQIIDPWGRILAEAVDPAPGIAVAEYDASLLAELRRKMPLLSHRRLC